MNKFLAIPTDLIKSGKLTHTELFIYIEICNLTELKKGCIASNNHFADLLGMTTKSVSNIISSLVKKGFIKTEIEAGSRNQIRRIFTIHNSGNSYPQNMDRVSTKYGESKENRLIEDTKERKNTKKENLFENLITENEHYDIYEDIANDFILHRKQIKKPLRTTAPIKAFIDALVELSKIGYSFDYCIEQMKANEWQTIKIDYIHKPQKQNNYQPQKSKDQIRREQIDKHFADLYPESDTDFDFDAEIVG